MEEGTSKVLGRSNTSPKSKSSKGSPPKNGMGTPILCAICREEVTAQNMGLMDGCNHKFCYICIVEWSKVTNTCPLCKKKFTQIKTGTKEGAETILTVEDKEQEYIYDNNELQRIAGEEPDMNQYDLNDSFIDDRSVEESRGDEEEDVQWLMEVTPSQRRRERGNPSSKLNDRRTQQLRELSRRRREEVKRKKKRARASQRSQQVGNDADDRDDYNNNGTQRTIPEQFSKMKEREERWNRRKKRATQQQEEEYTQTQPYVLNTTTTTDHNNHNHNNNQQPICVDITDDSEESERDGKRKSSSLHLSSQSSSSQDIRNFFVSHNSSQPSQPSSKKSKSKRTTITTTTTTNSSQSSKRRKTTSSHGVSVVPHSPSPLLTKPKGSLPTTLFSRTGNNGIAGSVITAVSPNPSRRSHADTTSSTTMHPPPSPSTPSVTRAAAKKITAQLLAARIKQEPVPEKENLKENHTMPSPLVPVPYIPRSAQRQQPQQPQQSQHSQQRQPSSQFGSTPSQCPHFASQEEHVLYQHKFQATTAVRSRLMPLYREKMLSSEEFAAIAKRVSDEYFRAEGEELLHKPIPLSPTRRDRIDRLLNEELRDYEIEL